MELKTTVNNLFKMLLIASLVLYPIIAAAENSKSEDTKIKTDPIIVESEKKDTTAKEEVEVSPVVEQKLEVETVSIDKDTVLLNTDKGPIKIKLFTEEAPITTQNFIDLVKKKFYDGTVFHRVVSDFVIQGGDPLGDGTGNYIDPETGEPRYIKLETSPNLKFDKAGRVGMARTSDPNSASCQFFIALMALPSLDPGGVDPYGYAVFGQVTEDTFGIVKKITEDNRPKYPGSESPANPVKVKTAILSSN